MQKKLSQYTTFRMLLVLFVAYLLFGFLFAPKIIIQQITQQLSSQLNMQAEMKAVKFNPLTFNTEIEGLKITDVNQQTWFNSQLTGINFDPLNLVWGQWKFSDLRLIQPKITLLTDQTGQVLIPAIPELPDSTNGTQPIDFTIEHISLFQGRMNLQAGNIKKDFELNLKSIEINHEKFILADEDTHFDIRFITENDESIALKGHYNHSNQVINSDIELTDWKATTFNQILPDKFAINNQVGKIQAHGNVAWQLSSKPLLNFGSIEIQSLQSQIQTDVTVNQLFATIQQVTIDTEKQTVFISSIDSNSGEWQINWPLNSDNLAATENTEANAVSGSNTLNWQVSIEQVNLSGWPIELFDNRVNASLALILESLELMNVNNLNQTITANSQLNLSASSTLNVTSDLVLSPLTFNADFSMTQLSLTQIAPWITQQSGLVMTAGQLDATQKITVKDNHFRVTGKLSVNDAKIENQNQQRIVNWDQLIIGANTISSQDQTILVDQITLDRATGDMITKDPNKKTSPENLKATDNFIQQAIDDGANNSDWSIIIGTIKTKDTNAVLIDKNVQPEVKPE